MSFVMNRTRTTTVIPSKTHTPEPDRYTETHKHAAPHMNANTQANRHTYIPTHSGPNRDRTNDLSVRSRLSAGAFNRCGSHCSISNLVLAACTRRTILSGTRLNEKMGSISSTSITDR